MSTKISDIQQNLLSADDLSVYLHVSIRKVRELDARGGIPLPLKIGGSKRWSLDELQAWVAAGAPGRQKWEIMKANKENN